MRMVGNRILAIGDVFCDEVVKRYVSVYGLCSERGIVS